MTSFPNFKQSTSRDTTRCQSLFYFKVSFLPTSKRWWTGEKNHLCFCLPSAEFMDFGVDTKINPWTADKVAVALNNALLLAEKTGHICRRGDSLNETVQIKVQQMPSLRMINLQKELSQHNIAMNKVNFEIQKRMLYHETKDLVDISVIEQRTNNVKRLVDHLQLVISNKDYLLTRLQQPFAGEYLKIGAQFHRYACELFTQIAPALSDLTSHIDDLAWVNTNSLLQNQLDQVLTDISSALAIIQTGFQTISHMSNCISSLQSGTILHTSFKDSR